MIERNHNRPPLSAAFGGGGPFAIGFNAGVTEALIEHGADLKSADKLGTSGGSWTAAMIATETGVDAIEELPDISLGDKRSREEGLLQGFTHEIFGDQPAENVRATAVRLGRFLTTSLQVLDSSEYSVADMVAASSSVPGIYKPTVIDGRKYIDGGMASNTSLMSAAHAHRAANADRLLVTSPLTFSKIDSALSVSAFKLMAGAIDKTHTERRLWEVKTGGSSIQINPDLATSRLVRTPGDLFDRRIALETYDRTLDHTRERLENPNDKLTKFVMALTRAQNTAASRQLAIA